ncbi:MAG: imidazoleglycerol-phosphate dehydratase HisB [Balneolaceae bacterium]|nr:MAG: imidazoleglycerol-phosphate dehydratase HisB [Balneolaceae bacterium]
MNIRIDKSAFSGDSPDSLPPYTLFAMNYLAQHGYTFQFDHADLSPAQKQFVDGDELISTDGPVDGTITKNSNYELISDGVTVASGETWRELAKHILFPIRKAHLKRDTKETKIEVSINLDGTGKSSIQTGIHFFNHMLDQIARHGLIDIELTCDGDLEVDEHHTIEDTAIALGQAIRQAISDNKAGIQRYGFVLPMDEAQATVAIDLSDRPYLVWEVPLKREYVGDFPTEMLEHFFYSLAMNAKATLHVKADGKNEHHVIEAVFKGFAKALRFSISRNERIMGILPSTKGTI